MYLTFPEAFDYKIHPQGLDEDTYYLKYKMLDLIFGAGDMISNVGYLTDIIEEKYFNPGNMGNWDAMTDGLADVGDFQKDFMDKIKIDHYCTILKPGQCLAVGHTTTNKL